MSKPRKIVVPDALAQSLGVDEITINQKMQQLIQNRAKLDVSVMFNESEIAKDYNDSFSKEEIIAVLMHAMSNAGVFEFKIYELIDKANIPQELVNQVMGAKLPSDEEFAKLYKKRAFDSPVTPQEGEEEDFI